VKYGAIPYSITHGGAHCAEFAQQTLSGLQPIGVFCNGQTLPDGSTAHISALGTIQTWQTLLTSVSCTGRSCTSRGTCCSCWIFGNSVEDSMGLLKFACFYLLGGIAALALQVAIDPSSTAPTIGASGAIAAVLGGYAVLYPRARVLTFVIVILFVTVIELPALVMLGLSFIEQAAFAATNLTNPTGGGVAYFAHIGGFTFGAADRQAPRDERQARLAPAPLVLTRGGYPGSPGVTATAVMPGPARPRAASDHMVSGHHGRHVTPVL
jgi:membrane associated rhomboid family serine protease